MESSADPSNSVLGQAWVEEQAALYQSRFDDPLRPSPVEFAARAVLPRDAALQGIDLRARLTRRLRILEGLHHALGRGEEEDFAPGSVFQDLEILEPIGRGGMGRVFRARQLSVDRVVALKAPHWTASLDPRERARFWREAQAIAKLRHPGIVPLFAVGERGGCPFLVLEHVEGRALSQVIQDLRAGILPRDGRALGRPSVSFERAAAQVALEILSALQAAHAAGIVHRDLKPGNVMLEASGRVRVLDFGLARLPQADELTRSQELLGTIDYTAPEVLENPRSAGPVSDLYSVGVLLYELVSLKKPFGNLPLQPLIARILSAEPEPLRARCRVAKSFSAIISKAMARDTARRYRSAAEFAADLESFLHGRSVSARPSSRLTRLQQGVRGRFSPVAATAIAVALGTFALAWNGNRRALARVDQVEARVNRVEARVERGAPLAARDEASAKLRGALIWEQADTPRAGNRPKSGRSKAIELLESALHEDPALPGARLHLAVLEAEAREEAAALKLLEPLESAGWNDGATRRVRRLIDSGETAGEGPVPPPPQDAGTGWSNSAVERFYFIRSRAFLQDWDAALQASAGLEGHPLYGAAVLFIEGVCWRHGGRADLSRAIRQFYAAEALVPDHPVIVANLLECSGDLVLEQGLRAEQAELYLAPVLHAADSVARSQPVHAAFWESYARLVGGVLGDHGRAREVLSAGLAHSPDDPGLLGNLAQTYVDEITRRRAKGEVVPEELATTATALLERAVSEDPGFTENRIRLASLYLLRAERQKVLDHITAARGFPLDAQQERKLSDLQREAEQLQDCEH